MVAQPIFQEPPAAFSHSSNYWRQSSSYDYENLADTEVCRETTKDFTEARDHLIHVKEILLDRVDCGGKGNAHCTKIIVSSVGRSLIRHPPRFVYSQCVQ